MPEQATRNTPTDACKHATPAPSCKHRTNKQGGQAGRFLGYALQTKQRLPPHVG